MKLFFAPILILTLTLNAYAQVGIGTTTPQAALDIQSGSNGLLIPRVALTSDQDLTTVNNPKGGDLTVSTMVYNIGTAGLSPAGFYYWDGTQWRQFVDTTPKMQMGKAVISSTGDLMITGLPFQPKRITFTAYANVDSFDLDADNGVGNNNGGIPNVFGNMTGYAQESVSGIDQQVIYIGGSGNSINDISRFASSSHCVGLRYADKNGSSLGLTSASVTSFNADGFTINVDAYVDSVVVLYEAYSY